MASTLQTEVRIPKGIRISEPVRATGPAIEKCSEVNWPAGGGMAVSRTAWCYLFVHNSKVPSFTERLERDQVRHFIHKSVVYQRKKHARGVRSFEKPTISGLVFLQGTPRHLQRYLDLCFPNYHLVKNCSTHLPAVIPDAVMQPFMRVLDTSPERIRFLLHPFRHYAGGNVKLRITSGFLAGLEGYVIRIDRDRRLVMDVGGMSVAIAGVHCETFEVVEDESSSRQSAVSVESKPPVRQLTELQQRIADALYLPQTQQEISLVADVLLLWKERALLYLEKWQVAEAKEILFFLLEEIDYRFSSLLGSTRLDAEPILAVARLIAHQIDDMTTHPRLTEETRQEITSERDGCLSRFGYLFAE